MNMHVYSRSPSCGVEAAPSDNSRRMASVSGAAQTFVNNDCRSSSRLAVQATLSLVLLGLSTRAAISPSIIHTTLESSRPRDRSTSVVLRSCRVMCVMARAATSRVKDSTEGTERFVATISSFESSIVSRALSTQSRARSTYKYESSGLQLAHNSATPVKRLKASLYRTFLHKLCLERRLDCLESLV
jgi:hypothetical protein